MKKIELKSKSKPNLSFDRNREYIPKGFRKSAKSSHLYCGSRSYINSNHITGIIRKYLGKKWNDCYSELIKVIDPQYKDEIKYRISLPVYLPKTYIAKVHKYTTTHIYKNLEIRKPEYSYKVIGKEEISEGWYYPVYRRYYSLDTLKRTNFYSDTYYVDSYGIIRVIKRNPSRQRKKDSIEYDYDSHQNVKVDKYFTINIVTEKDKEHYRWHLYYEKQKEERIKPKPEPSTYVDKVKGYKYISKSVTVGNETHWTTVLEPVIVQKRVKTKVPK